MAKNEVSNRDLVEHSDSPLTHKQISRARKGRWLTPAMRLKICSAVNSWRICHQPDSAPLRVRDLFDYCRDHGDLDV